MRLIDADKLNEEIVSICKCNPYLEGMQKETVYIKDVIDEQSTAYDVNKVVEEFDKKYNNSLWIEGNEEFSITRNELIKIVKQVSVGTETKTIRDKATEWNNHSSKKVPYEFIDFVEGKREIAKDDDVCKWREDAYGRWHTQCNILADNSPLEYTYCPYCGKKIKVVE